MLLSQEEGEMPDRIRVLVADPHSFVRQGLRSILEPDPLFVVVGEAAPGRRPCAS